LFVKAKLRLRKGWEPAWKKVLSAFLVYMQHIGKGLNVFLINNFFERFVPPSRGMVKEIKAARLHY